MINVNPQGNIWLCKTGLKNDYKNTLTFASSTAQYNFFSSKIQNTLTEYTYIKHDSAIKVGLPIDKIINCDYLFYANGGFESELNVTPYYYCFITNMEYVNENTTLITFETDCFQTWYWRLVYNPCFVEREHTNDDTIGYHTVPEGLETGEYIVDDKYYYDGLDDLMYIIQSTETASGGTNVKATNFGGVFMQGYAYACENMSQFTQIITDFDNASKHDAVYNCYTIPANFIATTPGQLQFSGQVAPIEDAIQINKPTTIDGYSPKNNKLFTYPYRYLLVSNNNGSSNTYQYERWDAVTCNFMVKGVPVVGGSIKLVPTIYDGQLTPNEDEGLMAGKFPTLNWATDPYTNWLTQNSVNIGVGVGTSALQLVGGIASATLGGPAGVALGGSMIISGLSGVTSTLSQVYQHSLEPVSSKGNTNGGDINVCSHKNGFTFYHMSIKREYVAIIDDYFSMFGYKIARIKVPNITGRQNWNYVKTIDCNFSGNIPQTDLEVIKSMFNNGVTLWHNPSTMYNYNNTNNIV